MDSPLHRVIDAWRWDSEPLLGRLFIVFHAAFLDAGFLPAAADPLRRRIPEQVGATASTLSLRYLVPQLRAFVALRVCAQGRRHLVFYVDTCSVTGGGGRKYLRARVDVAAAAPLLSGGLDETARALRDENDALAMADGLSRRVLAELCGGGGTSFMSLPGYIKAEILARLGHGEDFHSAAAALGMPPWCLLYLMVHRVFDPLDPPPRTYDDPPELSLSAAATKYLDGLAEAETARWRHRAMAVLPSSWSSSGGGRDEKRRHHVGAVNSPSARYRWKHR